MKCCSLAIGWQTVLAQRPQAPTVTVMDAMDFSVSGGNPALHQDSRGGNDSFIFSGITQKKSRDESGREA